ncbi:hypothetical protein, conserved [Angomonas deanei]|uniref:Flagellar attachment zone protein 1 conserved domain-containing protein n=1 Tax=Angomonas deanei TaxID=59799 RepID=A0A7G2C305_9TRYP|nr:hypothetical protein, conserved [Angomonas deanei]
MTAEKESVDAENAQLKETLAATEAQVAALSEELEQKTSTATEKERELCAQNASLRGTCEEVTSLLNDTNDVLGNALEKVRLQAEELTDLRAHDERWPTPADSEETVTTAHTKVFEGDEWDIVLDGKTEALRTAFSYDAASACHVLPTAIDNITFALGSLHVNFTVEHSDSVTKEELDDRISSYPFRCVDDLYRNRHAPKSGADALKETLAATEAQVAALSEELEQKTSTAAEKEQQMTAEKESVDAENAQLKETLAATEAQVAALSEELEQKTSTAAEKEQQLTAEKESVDAELAQLKETLAATEAQVAALSEELEQKTSTATEKEQQMTAEKESVDAENAQLKETLAATEAQVAALSEELEQKTSTATEKERELCAQNASLRGTCEEVTSLLNDTNDVLGNALEKVRLQAEELTDLRAHDERWPTPADSEETVTTAHTKVFEGDEWDIVLDGKTEALRTAFSYDAASACHVLPTAIDNITFALGSLHVNFTVEHSDSVTKEELDDRISSYPFRCVDDLYRNRHAPKSGADALKETLAATEAQVAALSKELEQKTSTAAEKEQQMTAEKESVDAENAQLKETLSATEAQVAALSKELEQKTSTATEKEQQLTAEKESVDAENAQLKETLAATEAQVAALSEELEQKTSTAAEKEQQMTAEKESVDAENSAAEGDPCCH